MLNGLAVGLVLGFLVATGWGALFHVFVGGPAGRILLYIVLAWLGFIVGHLVGDGINFSLAVVGNVQLFTASVGAWTFLLIGRWLWGSD